MESDWVVTYLLLQRHDGALHVGDDLIVGEKSEVIKLQHKRSVRIGKRPVQIGRPKGCRLVMTICWAAAWAGGASEEMVLHTV